MHTAQPSKNHIKHLIQTGHIRDAESLCLEAREAAPKDFDYRYFLGVIFLLQGKNEQAKESLEHAVTLNSAHSASRSDLGEAYMRLELWDKAEEAIEKAIGLDAGNAAAYLNLSRVYFKRRDYDKAEICLRKSAQLQPSSPLVFDNLGVCYREKGQLELALEAHMKAFELNAKLPSVYVNLAKIYLLLHEAGSCVNVIMAGVKSGCLDAFSALELYVHGLIVMWLQARVDSTLNILEACKQLRMKEGSYYNLPNLRAYVQYVEKLVSFRADNPARYADSSESSYPSIYFIGESHSLTPANLLLTYSGARHRVISTTIIGCKAFHLASQKSNKYKSSLARKLAQLPASSVVMIGVGEIDCRVDGGLLALHLSGKEDYPSSIGRIVAHYVEYVAGIAKSYQHQILFYGVPAPSEEALQGVDETKRAQLIDIVRVFNETLRKCSAAHQCGLIDVYPVTNNQDGASDGSMNIDRAHLYPSVFEALFG